eukprot:12929790-Prorocentrum_lima.AAC.1
MQSHVKTLVVSGRMLKRTCGSYYETSPVRSPKLPQDSNSGQRSWWNHACKMIFGLATPFHLQDAVQA